MKLVTYRLQNEVRTGALLDNYVVDLNRAYKAVLHSQKKSHELALADTQVPTRMIHLLRGGEASLNASRVSVLFVEEQLEANHEELASQAIIHSVDRVQLLPPVRWPSKVLCVGLNYLGHVLEAGKSIPQYPVLFHKTATSLIGHGQAIVIPRISHQINHEGEVALIIGKCGKYIAEDDAISYIAGYACANDVYAFDLQSRTEQWTTGVMLDTFCPLGPLVTRDEIPNPNRLHVKTMLNGDVMQEGNTANMIFNIQKIVSYVSSLATLVPGDVILTGTPASGGLGTYLKPGDCATVEIEGLGLLTNPVVAEQQSSSS